MALPRSFILAIFGLYLRLGVFLFLLIEGLNLLLIICSSNLFHSFSDLGVGHNILWLL